jgi:hypothetical protein
LNLDKRRVGQRRSEVLGMVEAHRAIIPGGQDQRRFHDLIGDISGEPEIDHETPTGLAAQQELSDLSDVGAQPARRHLPVECAEVLKNAGQVLVGVLAQ